MEVLILAHLSVTPEDLRALANQRATAVRNRLEIDGKVSRERPFLVEPKLTPAGIQDKGAITRVDFSLKRPTLNVESLFLGATWLRHGS
jgi:hypothetical protein